MVQERNYNGPYPVENKNPSLLGLIKRPTEQLERIKQSPKIILPLIIVTILTVIGMAFAAQGIDFLKDDPELIQAEEEFIMILVIIATISFVFVGLFTPVVSILFSTLIYFVIAKIIKKDVTFRQLFSMNTYLFIINSVGIIVNGVFFIIFGEPPYGEETMYTSLNMLFGLEGLLGTLLNFIELFYIWSIFLTVIGLQVVANFSKRLSWTLMIIFAMIGITLFTLMELLGF